MENDKELETAAGERSQRMPINEEKDKRSPTADKAKSLGERGEEKPTDRPGDDSSSGNSSSGSNDSSQ